MPSRYAPSPDSAKFVREVEALLPTSHGAVVYQLPLRVEPCRAGSLDADQLVEELSKDPEFAAQIREARPLVAETLYKGTRTLAVLRLERGMSQQDLARAAGTSQPDISFYECGRRQPTLGTARRIATALGISLGELADVLEA